MDDETSEAREASVVADRPKHQTSPVQPDQHEQPAVANGKKNVLLAIIASVLIPGAGQIYNGQPGKGFALTGVQIVVFTAWIAERPGYVSIQPPVISLLAQALGVVGWIILIVSAYDAYETAKKMNRGEIPFRKTKNAFLIGFIVLWLVWFIFIEIYSCSISPGG